MLFRLVKPRLRGSLISAALVLLRVGSVSGGPSLAADLSRSAPVFGATVIVSGADLRCLTGVPSERVGILACHEVCGPIPWQLDERGPDGTLALENGPHPNPDDPPGIIDANDEIHWMAEDSGLEMPVGERPADATCALEIRLGDETTGYEGRVYAFAWPGRAPRANRSYVRYDPVRDVLIGRRVVLGPAGPTPRYLALVGDDGVERGNLLDRLKIRVSAWFLGVIPVARDEDDVTTEFVAWHAGPIRVVRRQRQWVRVGFGIRSPTFDTYTYFYRDHAELPVSLGLHYPPTYFFRRIDLRAVLDFRDLRGWKVLAEGLPEPLVVGSLTQRSVAQLDGRRGDWFALIGPEVTLVQFLSVSPSLATVRRSLAYAESTTPQGPEEVPGEMPGVGYSLSRWNDVPAGRHWFSSTSVALPPELDVRDFARARRRRLTVHTRELGTKRED